MATVVYYKFYVIVRARRHTRRDHDDHNLQDKENNPDISRYLS